MNPIDNQSDKYLLLSEVANKCSSLAEKWNLIANERKVGNRSLADELINRAVKQQLFLYCFKLVEPTLLGFGKKWFFIWSDNLKYFSSRQSSIDCHLFLVSSKDRIKFDRNYDSKPRLMEVRRSDLYLNLDELKKLEENDQDFTDLAREEVKVETDCTPEEPNNTKPTVSKKEISIVPIIDKSVDFQPSKDASESAFSSTSDSGIVTVTDAKPSLASGIVQESHSMAQAEKPTQAKQPKKKKEKAFPRNIDDAAEPPLLSKDDREPLPLKTLADLQTRFLSLEEIVSDKKKGRKGIFPFGKSTWYAGIKSGRFPKSFEMTGGRGVGWRGSDIYALLQKMGMI